MLAILNVNHALSYVSDDLDFAPVGEERGHGEISGPRITVSSINYQMVYIRPGRFMMGSPSNEPGRDDDEKQHQVTLTRGFYMGATEVTQGQWRKIMGSNPSHFKNCGDDCPVESVSWNDAKDFIGRLNKREGTDKYRLPTEAEWEYAARAGTTTRYGWGSSDPVCEPGRKNGARFDDNRKCDDIGPAAVGTYLSNSWGLYDMHGNVWEWCQDRYGNYPSGMATDPEGPRSGSHRVIRGGSWSNSARICRSANRNRDNPGFRDHDVGFRLARTY